MQRYVSDELTHFVGRGRSEEEQYAVLVKILSDGWLTHAPHIPGISGYITVNARARLSENQMYVPGVVCFCDIPLADLRLHMAKYSPFGVAFLKSFLVPKGSSPVFYVPRNSTVHATWE